MLLTVGQRKFSARIRFYSWFNYINSRDPDLALRGFSSTNTLVWRWGQKKQSHFPITSIFFSDSTLPSSLLWHQKVHVDAVDQSGERTHIRAGQTPFPGIAFSWMCFSPPAHCAAAGNLAVAPRMAWHRVEGEIRTGAKRKQDCLFR